MSVHRRTFLAELAAASAIAIGPTTSCARKHPEKKDKSRNAKTTPSKGSSRVVVVRCPGVNLTGHSVARKKVQDMLRVGLRTLAGLTDHRAAVARWIRPVDTVGLKVNCLAGRQMSTHVELVEELVALLEDASVPRRQAMVFDRADQDLRRGGFPIRTSGSDYRCQGNDRAGYERNLRVMPSGASRFSLVATRKASVLVNMPILKDHGLAGISGALKNNFGLVHNPNKFHLNGCDPHVAEVNAQPFVRSKQRLVICDALRVQTEGGPAFHAAGAATYGGLLFATDPVALDRVAWEILEELRKKKKLPTLSEDRRRPVHIFTAARQGLGRATRSHITRVDIKVS